MSLSCIFAGEEGSACYPRNSRGRFLRCLKKDFQNASSFQNTGLKKAMRFSFHLWVTNHLHSMVISRMLISLQKFRLKNLCRMESYRIDVYLKSMSLRHGLRWKAGIDATISIDTRKAQIRIANLRSAIKSMKSRKPMFSTKTKWFSKGLAKYHVWVLAYSILKVL